jgi:hypothetical protein
MNEKIPYPPICGKVKAFLVQTCTPIVHECGLPKAHSGWCKCRECPDRFIGINLTTEIKDELNGRSQWDQ